MPRGGFREKAGRKSTWKSGCSFAETKLIRVPAKIADQVLEFAHNLDSGSILDSETNSESASIADLQVEIQENPGQLLLFDAIPSHQPSQSDTEGLSGRALAKKLGVSSGTLQERRNRDTPSQFAQWTTKAKNSDGTAWEYNPNTKLYHPIQ